MGPESRQPEYDYEPAITPFQNLRFIVEAREREITEIQQASRNNLRSAISGWEEYGEDGETLRELVSLLPEVLNREQCYLEGNIKAALKPIQRTLAATLSTFVQAMIMGAQGISRPLVGEYMRVTIEFYPNSQPDEKILEFKTKIRQATP